MIIMDYKITSSDSLFECAQSGILNLGSRFWNVVESGTPAPYDGESVLIGYGNGNAILMHLYENKIEVVRSDSEDAKYFILQGD